METPSFLDMLLYDKPYWMSFNATYLISYGYEGILNEKSMQCNFVLLNCKNPNEPKE